MARIEPVNVEEFEQHRALLFAVAYRMLGSANDAEDVLQDAWLRWSKVTDEVREPAAYLVQIVTRLSIDALKSARARREQYVGLWLPEPLPTGDDADIPLATVQRRELLSLGILTLLERLNPTERAVLVLRGSGPHAQRDCGRGWHQCCCQPPDTHSCTASARRRQPASSGRSGRASGSARCARHRGRQR